MFKPSPEFKGFSNLFYLELCKIVVTANVFSSLISSCPLLEYLTVESCSSVDCLEIDAPKLIFLSCQSHVSSICFKNTSLLFIISITLEVDRNENKISFKEGETSNMVMLFDSLPVIQYLEIDYYYVKVRLA